MKTLVDPAAQNETTADETEGAAPDKTLKEAAKKGPTAEEIVEPIIKTLAAKGVEEIAVLRDDPGHTRDVAARGGTAADATEEVEETEDIRHEEPLRYAAWEDDTSDGPGGGIPNELKKPGSERNEVTGRGPG